MTLRNNEKQIRLDHPSLGATLNMHLRGTIGRIVPTFVNFFLDTVRAHKFTTMAA